MPFSLHPASESDIPVLARITNESSERDAHTDFKVYYGDYNHEKTMTGVLEALFARPRERCHITKAVDDETNEAVGWVAWGYRHGEPKPDHMATTTTTTTTTPASQASPSQPEERVQGEAFQSDGQKHRPLARLEAETSADLERWKTHFMPPGTSCMFIISISVLSQHQGKGIGTALVRHGTSQADSNDVFCWVHASDSYWWLFAKEDFKEVGRLVIDLDKWAREEEEQQQQQQQQQPKQETERKKWGEYTFRYMKRLPATLSPSSSA